MGDGLARQQLQGGVVVDVTVLDHAAMAVIRILAETDVGDDDELRHVTLERTHRLLHRALVVPRLGPGRILGVRDPEEQHAADAQRRGLARVAQQLVDRRLGHARHRIRWEWRTFVPERTNKGSTSCDALERRFAHEPAQRSASAAGAGRYVGNDGTRKS